MTAPAILAGALTRLATDWPKPPWGWDGRFSTVSCAVTGTDIPTARALAARALPHAFDGASLVDAPPILRALLERCGGLRGNQLAMCDDTSTPTAFALWWPWGGGDTVSLRIGLVEQTETSTSSLRALFRVA